MPLRRLLIACLPFRLIARLTSRVIARFTARFTACITARTRTRRAAACLLVATACAPHAVHAWGDEGHQIVAAIAYGRLAPAVRQKVDLLLLADTDTLSARDFRSRATWADRWRDADRNTTQIHYRATREWHFVDTDIDTGDLDAACNGRPPLPPGTLPSAGPARACVIDKIDQFAAALHNPATPKAERIRALKFLMHFVGDLHQPLHAAEHNHDSGGNAVLVLYGQHSTSTRLHAYWDTVAVRRLGGNVEAAAIALRKTITPAKAAAWSAGTSADWALDALARARDTVYNYGGAPTAVDERGEAAQFLDAAYEARALAVVREQLAKGGMRLAAVLNKALK